MKIVYLINKTKRLVAIVGMLGIIFSSGPMQILSVMAQDNELEQLPVEEIVTSQYPTTMDPEFDPSSIALLNEVLEERTNASKTFRKMDGTLETALYKQNVHYHENGEWKEIDNSFNDIGQELENKENSFKLKFPKTIDDNKTIKFTENEYGIDWSILDINTSPIIYDDSVLTPNSIRELININRTVMYEDVLPGVDIEYVLYGDRLKENIILEQYVQDFSLSFEYKLKDLSLVQDMNGKYVFVNDLNEVVYQFTDLFMFDNSLNYSEDILLSVTEIGNKTYLVTLTPSDEWLQNAVYPVVIDPAFEDPGDGGSGEPNPTYNNPLIRDKETSDSGVIETSYYQRVGRYNSNNYKTYVEVDFSSVPDNAIITYSHLLVGTYTNPSSTCSDSNGCVIEVRKVNQTSDWADITSSIFSDVEDFIEDYNIISDNMGIRRWDVSKAFYDWHSASYDFGILELSMDYGIYNNYVSFASETYSLVTGPNMVIGYQSTTGLHDYLTYHSAPVGDAGTIMVSDFTGELNLVRNDYTGNHSGMVIDFGMFYSENLKDTNIGYGYGWRTNFNSTAYYDSPDYEVVNPSGSTTRYEQVSCSGVTDEPEIRNYSLNCYLANDGSRRILVSHDYDHDSTNEIIVYSTNRVRTIYESGNLSKIEDLKTGYFLEVSYTNGKISKVEDHYGNYVTLEYDSIGNLKYELVQLCQTWDTSDNCTKTNLVEVVQFGYTTGADNTGHNLDNVKYYKDYSGTHTYYNIENSSDQAISSFFTNAKSDQVYYSYDDETGEDNKLRIAKSSTDVLVSVEYLSNTKVDKYTFKKGSNNLGFIDISYNKYETLFTDHKGNQVRYSFDSYGHTVNILDDFGNAIFNKYLNAFSDTINGAGNKFLHHKLVESSLPQKTQLNPISNHSFENSTVDDWNFVIDDDAGASVNFPYHSYNEDAALFGQQGLRMDNYIYQASHLEQTIVLDQGTYTLSGYVKSSTTSSHVRVSMGTTDYDSTSLSSTGEWLEKEVQFTVNSDNTTVTIELHNKGYYSEFDNIMISDSFVDTRINILDNPSFESSTTGWTLSGVTRVANNVETIEGDLHDSILGDYSLKITGNPLTRKYFETTLTSSQFNTGQYYIVAGWAKGNTSAINSNLNGEDDKVYGILVTLSDGTTSQDLYFPFNSDIETWQYQANKFYVDSSITSIKVKVMFQGEGSVLFDGLQVYNESFGTEYAYDNYGNTEHIKTPDASGTIDYVYESGNRFMLDKVTDQNGKTTDPSFDTSGLFKDVTQNNVASSVIRNTNNQIEEVKVGVDSNKDGVVDGSYYQNFISYTTNYQYIDKVTDEFGNEVDFVTNILTGLLSSVENEKNIVESYSYDEKGRTITISKDSTNNTYLYVDDLLSEIQINGITYKLTYDNIDRLDRVEVGSGTGQNFTGTMLKEFVFETDIENSVTYETNRLLEERFGNGGKIKLTYNDENQVEGIWFYETSHFVKRYEYQYNQSGVLTVLKDLRDNQEYYYNYDLVGRIRKVTNQDGDVITYDYDNAGNLHVYTFDIQGYSRSTTFDYSLQIGRYNKTTAGNLIKDYIFEGEDTPADFTDDGLHRLEQITLTLSSTRLNTITYSYYEGTNVTHGDISRRVKSITQVFDSGTYSQSMEYTEQGFVKKITNHSSQILEFFYDEKDQLVRENNQIDNYTYIYNYDNYGNRVSMKYYSFRSSSTSLGTLYETQLFTYHSIWKDKIQSYSISYEFAPDYNYLKTYYYDNSGNITLMDDSRGTTKDIAFSWEGRHLSSYTSSSVTATYTYNQSGIRDAKTVNGITTEYVLDGTRVIYEKTGSTDMYYTYDVDGSLLSMIYNGTEYFYVFNVFGDITHLLDSNGNVVVEYRYDAYGNIKYKTPSSQLADANPYRYRGYRYDEETNLYYLQSRYYNPETGRFINADGMLKASNTVLGHNMFTYTENNPVMNTDPTGYCVFASPNEMESLVASRMPCGGGPIYHYNSGWSPWRDDVDVDFESQMNQEQTEIHITSVDGYKTDIRIKKVDGETWIEVNTVISYDLLEKSGGIEKNASAILHATRKYDWNMPVGYNRLEGEIALHYYFYRFGILKENAKLMEIGNETGFRINLDKVTGDIAGVFY